MKILLAEEMRTADSALFSRIGVPSRAVMESAGREVAGFLLEQMPDLLGQGVLVLAGSGNNGGDGFVVARTLLGQGVYVEMAAVKAVAELKGDALANALAYQNAGGRIVELTPEHWFEAECVRGISSFGVVVDALCGTGFHGQLQGFIGELVDYLNTQAEVGNVAVVSIDLPSGVETDTGAVNGPAVSANATIALQCLKPAHVCYPGAGYCGETFVADIGVCVQMPEIESVQRELITEESIAALLQEYIYSPPEEHKGERGHVIVIGGGAGHLGAPRMSAEAALVCGSGLVTLVVPDKAAQTMACSVRELMCLALDSDDDGSFSGGGAGKLGQYLAGKDALVAGPGMGTGPGAEQLLTEVLRVTRELSLPVVLDADALNVVAQNWPDGQMLETETVLTPHPGEMARLLRTSTAQVQLSRMHAASALSKKFGCWVVLKGARTVIAGPDGTLLVNPTAIPTLATAGSGDVLAGMIGSFLARGFPARAATACAVFVHGCAGEVGFIDNRGPIGTLAGDVLGYLPSVINALLSFHCPMPRRLRKVLPGSMHLLAQDVSDDAG